MNMFNKRLFNKHKGFTLIELIVVIAIIGILVLLAAPKFLGRIEEAKLTNIISDIATLEQELDLVELKEPGFKQSLESVTELPTGKQIYTTKSKLTELPVGGVYVKIPSNLIRTRLTGEFYLDTISEKAYYIDAKSKQSTPEQPETKKYAVTFVDHDNTQLKTEEVLEGGNATPPSNPTRAGFNFDKWDGDYTNVNSDLTITATYTVTIPDEHTLLTDSDFEFITDQYAPNIYNIGGESKKGYFHYTGTADKVIIPTTLMGNDLKDYYQMFFNSKATTLDLSNFNTSNVTNMREMFSYSQSKTLDLSSFDTSKVTNMKDMFNGSQAKTLDLSNFNTSNVTNMSYMFNASKATTLDLSSFDTSNVTDMSSMFSYSQAKTLDLTSFDTSKVTNMNGMFYNSQATKGYAKTSADANKFNASSNKPAGLKFVVK